MFYHSEKLFMAYQETEGYCLPWVFYFPILGCVTSIQRPSIKQQVVCFFVFVFQTNYPLWLFFKMLHFQITMVPEHRTMRMTFPY